MSDREAMLRTIFEFPIADAPRLVFADWLNDANEHWSATWFRNGCPTTQVSLQDPLFHEGFGDGLGYGTKMAQGQMSSSEPWASYRELHGGGQGYGYSGGWAEGDGCGYGEAAREGFGDGGKKDTLYEGDFQSHMNREITPVLELGSQALVILPHGFVLCGLVGEQKGVQSWQMHNVSMICRTNGIPWDELADGKNQDRPIYRKWGDVIIHNPIIVREWKGTLP